MNTPPGWLVLVCCVGLVAASAGTWFVCRWWYSRKLIAAAQRLHKSDTGRILLQQQSQQARRQVEMLQSELAAHRKATADSGLARQKTHDLRAALAVAEDTADAAMARMRAPSAHGFADTQILP